MIVQDTDLECEPEQCFRVLGPILSNNADIANTLRFLTGTAPYRVLNFWHQVGNNFFTLSSNMLTDLNLSDVLTCYKKSGFPPSA